ncbi:hypothetical protein [Streptomyces sp. NPDC048489]|uniref:hypothetical protein n=1 Tax=Streptomyces sp. NPDC048489 TaxID=3154504 RepID=UPI00343800D0
MIRPQLTVDGTAIRLPLADRVAVLVDELALAYAQDPEGTGRLLAAHAGAVFALDYAACSEDMPDHVRAIRAAEADNTREGLLELLPSAGRLDDQLSPDDAITLAGRLTKHASHIRHTLNRSTPQ